jgi:hypothetical protein
MSYYVKDNQFVRRTPNQFNSEAWRTRLPQDEYSVWWRHFDALTKYQEETGSYRIPEDAEIEIAGELLYLGSWLQAEKNKMDYYFKNVTLTYRFLALTDWFTNELIYSSDSQENQFTSVGGEFWIEDDSSLFPTSVSSNSYLTQSSSDFQIGQHLHPHEIPSKELQSIQLDSDPPMQQAERLESFPMIPPNIPYAEDPEACTAVNYVEDINNNTNSFIPDMVCFKYRMRHEKYIGVGKAVSTYPEDYDEEDLPLLVQAFAPSDPTHPTESIFTESPDMFLVPVKNILCGDLSIFQGKYVLYFRKNSNSGNFL